MRADAECLMFHETCRPTKQIPPVVGILPTITRRVEIVNYLLQTVIPVEIMCRVLEEGDYPSSITCEIDVFHPPFHTLRHVKLYDSIAAANRGFLNPCAHAAPPVWNITTVLSSNDPRTT